MGAAAFCGLAILVAATAQDCPAGSASSSCAGPEHDDVVALAGDASARALKESEPWARRCNIKRKVVKWADAGSLLSPLLPTAGSEPYIVSLPRDRNKRLEDSLRRGELLSSMGHVECTPSRAGNVRRDQFSMTLREYVEVWMERGVSRNASENRYVFGEFGDQWAPVRDAYVLPPCGRTCGKENVAITLGLGGLHSGAPWHFHGAAFVEVLHGAKHFALLPPGDPVWPEVNAAIQNVSQLHWHREERPRLESAGRLRELRECVLRPGELLYTPDAWYHGVVNGANYTAFMSSFLATDDVSSGAEEQPAWDHDDAVLRRAGTRAVPASRRLSS